VKTGGVLGVLINVISEKRCDRVLRRLRVLVTHCRLTVVDFRFHGLCEHVLAFAILQLCSTVRETSAQIYLQVPRRSTSETFQRTYEERAKNKRERGLSIGNVLRIEVRDDPIGPTECVCSLSRPYSSNRGPCARDVFVLQDVLAAVPVR
jgi:hypothetical protein